ncbi:MAG TPA: TIGR03545 family protein [Gemmatimonadales bacterium]|nr:TIGR03545 family protein [Gemmatimonadales bacterium]
MKVALFRWKAVIPFGTFVLILVLFWVLFGNWLVKRALEAGGTAAARAKVEIDQVRISLWQSRLTISGLTIASPTEAFKNTLQADQLDADFETLPLLRKKFIVDRLAATGLRFGTPRTTDGRVTPSEASSDTATNGPTTPGASSQPKSPSKTSEAAENLAGRLNFPILNLATGKLDVGTLDPSRLSTETAARSLQARADSAQKAWNAALLDLHTGPTVDSAVALANRLKGAKPTDLTAVNNARRMLSLLSQAKDKVDALGRGIAAGASDLQHGVAQLDSAKARDLETARGLVKLPALDASQIGAAVFGPAAAGKFEKALHWVRVARQYAPGGLTPHATPAPKRVRRAGTTVRFPREHDLPAFWLKSGDVSFTLDSTRNYSGKLADLTTSQTLTGKPTTFNTQTPALQAGALLDHRRPQALDTISGVIPAVKLPDLAIPVGGIHLAPGAGTMSFRFALEGEILRAGWDVKSSHITWTHDSAAAGGAGGLVWQVVSGISTLDVSARLSGTPESPSLSVRSNLDQAISDRIKGLMGNQVKAAEQKLTAQVNAYADPLIAPVKSQVASVTGTAQQQLGASQSKIADAQKQLQQRLKSLTGGIRLP